MSDKYIRGSHGDIALNALPGNYVVANFTVCYEDYLKAGKSDDESSRNLGTLLQIIGGLILLVGVVGLGGPSVIQVGPQGPTFIQMIEIFPGPIMTLGFFLITMGGWVKRQGADPMMDAESYLQQAWRIKMPCGHYCDEPLAIRAIAPDTFRIARSTELAGDTAPA